MCVTGFELHSPPHSNKLDAGRVARSSGQPCQHLCVPSFPRARETERRVSLLYSRGARLRVPPMRDTGSTWDPKRETAEARGRCGRPLLTAGPATTPPGAASRRRVTRALIKYYLCWLIMRSRVTGLVLVFWRCGSLEIVSWPLLFDLTFMHSQNETPVLRSSYLFWAEYRRGLCILIIFQDRCMFSHINGKLSPSPFEWYGWT